MSGRSSNGMFKNLIYLRKRFWFKLPFYAHVWLLFAPLVITRNIRQIITVYGNQLNSLWGVQDRNSSLHHRCLFPKRWIDAKWVHSTPKSFSVNMMVPRNEGWGPMRNRHPAPRLLRLKVEVSLVEMFVRRLSNVNNIPGLFSSYRIFWKERTRVQVLIDQSIPTRGL